jgi:hypothetical protein
MGKPLSPFVNNICVENFEQLALSIAQQKPELRVGYAVDTRDLAARLDKLNSSLAISKICLIYSGKRTGQHSHIFGCLHNKKRKSSLLQFRRNPSTPIDISVFTTTTHYTSNKE